MTFSTADIHQQIDAWLDAAEAGVLSPEEHRALDLHLQACPACRQAQREYQTMSNLLKETLTEKKPAPDFEDRLVARFRRGRREEPAPKISLAAIAEALRRLIGVRFVQYGGALAGLAALVMTGAVLTHETVHAPAGAPAPLSAPASNAATISAIGGVSSIAAIEASSTTTSPTLPYSKIASHGMANEKVDGRPTDMQNRDMFLSKDMANGPVAAARAELATAQTKVNSAPLGGFQTQAAAPIPSAPTATPDIRKVIRNAHVEFEVEKFETAVAAIEEAARAENGFVDTKTSARGANGKVSGAVVVKVVPERLDSFLARLSAIGLLKNQRIDAQDITKAYADTDARLRNARKMETRLLDILQTKSGKVSELLEVERELGRVRSDIEQMEAEVKMYDGQLAYATVTIVLAEKDLSQTASFIVKENAEIVLLAANVEKAFADATRRRHGVGGTGRGIAAQPRRGGPDRGDAPLPRRPGEGRRPRRPAQGPGPGRPLHQERPADRAGRDRPFRDGDGEAGQGRGLADDRP